MSGTEWLRTIGAHKGLSSHLNLTADNTLKEVKTSQGKLYALHVANPNSTDVWVQLFNKAKADITLGTTAPDLSFCIPAGDGTYNTTDKPIDLPVSPLAFSTAITYAVTTTKDGSTAPASDVVVNIAWK